MFAAKPATAGRDIFERLHLFHTAGAPTAFDLRRLEKDTLALENADKGDAYAAHAALCSLKWDLDGALSWIERASVISGTMETAYNAAITLRFMNRPDLAVQYIMRANERAPLAFDVANAAISTLAADGQLAEAATTVKAFRRRAGSEVAEKFDFDAEQFAEIFEKIGITEERLQREMRAAMSVLFAEKVRHRALSFEPFVEPDGAAGMAVEIRFDGTSDDELRMESKLAQLLMDMPDWDPCTLSVDFKARIPEDARQPV